MDKLLWALALVLAVLKLVGVIAIGWTPILAIIGIIFGLYAAVVILAFVAVLARA